MKVGSIVNLKDCGVGKVTYYPESGMSINIAGQNYYRDPRTDMDEMTEISVSEYVAYLKTKIKELSALSTSKRKEAAEYNKQSGGEATRRKGKVEYVNGYILPWEDRTSKNHRELLNEAKKYKELKDVLKRELEYYKGIGA